MKKGMPLIKESAVDRGYMGTCSVVLEGISETWCGIYSELPHPQGGASELVCSYISQVAQMVKNPPDFLSSGRSPGEVNGHPLLAWRLLWTEGPGVLWSMGSHRVRHGCS